MISIFHIRAQYYLTEFKKEQDRIIPEKTDAFVKSEKLYRLFAYKKALEILNNIKVTAKSYKKIQINYQVLRLNW